MQNRPIVNNMCEKFHFDRLRNDRSLGNGKSDNKKKNNAWRSDSGLKIDVIIAVTWVFPCRNTQKSISAGAVRSVKTPWTGELKTLPRCPIWFHWSASRQEGLKGVERELRTGKSGGRDDEWEGRMGIIALVVGVIDDPGVGKYV